MELIDKKLKDLKNSPNQNLNILPTQYEYQLCSYKELASVSGFSATLRLPIGTIEEAINWKREFQEISKVTLRIVRTFPHVGGRLLFREDLRCQHNTKKSGKVSKKYVSSSKNTNCKATMKIFVQRIPVRIRSYTDPHLPQFPMVVEIYHVHNHSLNSADVLRYRDVSNEVREKFLQMFKEGHTPLSALESHKCDLEMENENDSMLNIIDRSKLPDISWCYRLYYSNTNKECNRRDDIIETEQTNYLEDEEETVIAQPEHFLLQEDSPLSSPEIQTEDSDLKLLLCADKTNSDSRDLDLNFQTLKENVTVFFESLINRAEVDSSYFSAVETFFENSQKLKTDVSILSALRAFGKHSSVTCAITIKKNCILPLADDIDEISKPLL